MANLLLTRDQGIPADVSSWIDSESQTETIIALTNEAAQRGNDQQPGAHAWLRSARMVLDPKDNAIHMLVATRDPAVVLCLSVSKQADGQIDMHLSSPGHAAVVQHFRPE